MPLPPVPCSRQGTRSFAGWAGNEEPHSSEFHSPSQGEPPRKRLCASRSASARRRASTSSQQALAESPHAPLDGADEDLAALLRALHGSVSQALSAHQRARALPDVCAAASDLESDSLLPSDSLKVGAVAQIVGLQTRPDLNGQKVMLCEYDATSERWRVALDGFSEKMLRPENLAAVQPVKMQACGESGSRATLDSGSHATREVASVTGLQPVKMLPSSPACKEVVVEQSLSPPAKSRQPAVPSPEVSKSSDPGDAESCDERDRIRRGAIELESLLAQRHAALHQAAEETEGRVKRMGTLREELESKVQEHRPLLEEYTQLSGPATITELRRRNQTRSELLSLAESVKRGLEDILASFDGPADLLHTAESSVLQGLSSLQECLQRLREETAERFATQARQVEVARAERDVVLSGLRPQVTLVNDFLCSLSQELKVESAARQEVNASCIARLKEEETQFVRANHSPSTNPAFKRVRTEMEEIETGECAYAQRDEAQATLVRNWEVLLAKLPVPPVTEPAPAPPMSGTAEDGSSGGVEGVPAQTAPGVLQTVPGKPNKRHWWPW